MKIALITIHRTNNYGALMQVYATQKVLSKYGSVTVIDYRNEKVESSLQLFRFSFDINGIKALAKDVLRYIPRRKALKKVNSFIENRLNLSLSVDKENISSTLSDSFDLYVCGSDQIWNPKCISNIDAIDENYFCGFAPENSKIISYASSAGSHKYNDDEVKTVHKLLSRFSSLSVRESDLSKFLSKIISKPVAHVLDPTLLLNEDEWLEDFNDESISIKQLPERFILVYTVPKSSLLSDAIRVVKSRTGLAVVSVDQGLLTSFHVDKQIRDASPEDFISIFHKAEYIITDSFHGVCFSINFGKKFMAVSPGIYSNRIDSLLSIVGLTEKCIRSAQDLENFEFDYDYEKTKTRLDQERIKSLQFIDDSILN